jgi:hypothetical protein
MAAPKIKQLWFVIPLDLKEDPNKPYIGTGQGQGFAQEVARPARNPRRGEGDLVPEAVVSPGYGFGISMKDQKQIQYAFTTKQAAESYAVELAGKTPKTMYGVFGCLGTYETTTPTVIKKGFNSDGELVPEAQNA